MSHAPTTAAEAKPRKAEVGERSRPQCSWLGGAFALRLLHTLFVQKPSERQEEALMTHPQAGMGPSRVGCTAVAGTTWGYWGPVDVTSDTDILTRHLGLGPWRPAAGVNMFCRIPNRKGHSAAAGLHQGASTGALGLENKEITKPRCRFLCDGAVLSLLPRDPIRAPRLFLGELPRGWAC